MRSILILLTTLLSLNAYDRRLFNRKSANLVILAELDDFADEANLSQKQNKIVRRAPIPAFYYKGVRRSVRSKCNYFKTKSRDVRDLDQRKIRRKHTNML